MKSAQELAQYWGRRSLKFPGAELSEADMPAAAADVLAAGALPRSTSPFLSFGAQYTAGSKRRTWLPSVGEAFDLETEGLEHLCIIGGNGGGDPVAVHLDTGAVLLVDHEGSFSTEPISADVMAFARFLAAYDAFVRAVQDEHGSHGYVDGLFSAEQVDALEAELRAIDAEALTAGSFWARDLVRLRRAL